EMGHAPDKTSADNVLAYNLFVSSVPGAIGPNIHGGSPFAPIDRTTIYNNTIVFTGPNTQGIVCGCTGGATVENNIFVAECKAAFYAGTFVEKHNVYWDYKNTSDSTPDPFVQFAGTFQTSIDPSSKKADPMFVDRAAGNLRLLATSPAVDAGSSDSVGAGW